VRVCICVCAYWQRGSWSRDDVSSVVRRGVLNLARICWAGWQAGRERGRFDGCGMRGVGRRGSVYTFAGRASIDGGEMKRLKCLDVYYRMRWWSAA
jgi:hypothetical protein